MFGSSFAYLIVLTRRKAGKRKRKFPGSYIYLKNDNNKKYKFAIVVVASSNFPFDEFSWKRNSNYDLISWQIFAFPTFMNVS